MLFINAIAYVLFIAAIGYYFITNLQWYSYKLNRVIFHHTKVWWHYLYFLLPFSSYVLLARVSEYSFVVVVLYLPFLYRWYRGLDKPLVFTGRVKRFAAALFLFALFFSVVFQQFTVIIPLFLAYFVSMGIEKMLFEGFRRKAEDKLDAMPDMIIVGITASYGKTSIKNFIAHLLRAKYNTYATPRSVNTMGGVMKDINEDIPDETEVYVVEMGARGKGDIKEIATFVNPQYVVVGKIGPAHIEYFKSLETIRNTKMEILKTNRLKEAWIHESAMVRPEGPVHVFGTKESMDIKSVLPAPDALIENVTATLEGISFTLNGERYSANILGAFNAMNLAAAVQIARSLGLTNDEIQGQLETLEPVAQRLQRIDACGKVILDDSFNGNIDGMMASFALAESYQGRKILITPGLVEADDALNIEVAERANEFFDRVIVTGDLNYAIFRDHVEASKLGKLNSKAEMETMLIEETKEGDLILFANDAPSFV
ncbi:MAG TPA: UDP-N-acetylmuramoyl-tripeptide--D-alanyl-D-alanine ligase [Epsilonproteobacteria bacterium]|nr:UDP-N-acetylmuramoyl-tripeptide--D-alanyl-D-alanine ligase [Campylobacterota bacterium]